MSDSFLSASANFANGSDNQQLLDEIEHDSENYQGRVLCYLPKPKAEAANRNRRLDNSRYHAKTEFNNCFIIIQL